MVLLRAMLHPQGALELFTLTGTRTGSITPNGKCHLLGAGK
jgi:hypothetical protein